MTQLEQITKRDILSRISQDQIFEYYLGMRVDYGTYFRSPFRKDVNPTCSFKMCDDGILRMRDWTEHKTMDCFDIVKRRYGCSFSEALRVIYNDFDLIDIKPGSILPTSSYSLPGQQYTKKLKPVKRADIKVRTQPFTEGNIEYLKQFGITSDIVKKYKVYSIEYVEVNGLPYCYSSDDDPILGYFFGKQEDYQLWKLYFYKRKKGESKKPRFITNTVKIQGYKQLPDTANQIIITKSMKDIMCLSSFGICSVAPQSENYEFEKEFIDLIKRRFGRVIVLYDNDATGINYSNKLTSLYNIEQIFVPDKYKVKDISDFHRDFGRNKTFDLLLSMLTKV